MCQRDKYILKEARDGPDKNVLDCRLSNVSLPENLLKQFGHKVTDKRSEYDCAVLKLHSFYSCKLSSV